MQDQQVGLVMLLVATLIFIYYTIWTFVTPFLDDDSIIQNFFLPRYYAIALPVVALIVGISIVATFVGLVIVKSVQKKKATRINTIGDENSSAASSNSRRTD